MPPPHPLRRISTGSLSSLARSQDRAHPSSSSGLDFLQPALIELADEAATLSSNIQQMTRLHDALGTFNESFAAYLYALKMNAFCVEWPQAPDQNSFARAESLKPEPQPISLEMPLSTSTRGTVPGSPPSGPSAADLTYATAYSMHLDEPVSKPSTSTSARKVAPKPAAAAPAATGVKKTSAAVKKKRELEVAALIDLLPLEYRGNDPAARLAMSKVINKLMDNPTGLSLKDVIQPPELPQPRANKCLIALVAKKWVMKVNVGGTASYRWVGGA